MSNTQSAPAPGLYAFYFDELMAIQAFVNDDSDASNTTLVEEDVWKYIHTEEGKKRVKEWCDLHRLDFRQLAACPPFDDWSPDDLVKLLKRARTLFNNVVYQVRTARQTAAAAEYHHRSRGK